MISNLGQVATNFTNFHKSIREIRGEKKIFLIYIICGGKKIILYFSKLQHQYHYEKHCKQLFHL